MDHSDRSNNRLFELDLLRALVAVADCGSFISAAGRLSSTQSTVSQKARRLWCYRDVYPPSQKTLQADG